MEGRRGGRGRWDAGLIRRPLKIAPSLRPRSKPQPSGLLSSPADEVVSILTIGGEMSDVKHAAMKCRCKSAHALHHSVCQMWVWLQGEPGWQ